MLRWRLLAAAAIIGPLLGLIWLDDHYHAGRPGIWLASFAAMISIMAAHEVNQLWQHGGWPCSPRVNLLAVGCVVLASMIPFGWTVYPEDAGVTRQGCTLLGLAAALGVVFNAEILRYRQPGESLLRLAGGSFVVFYVGLNMGMLIQLRMLQPSRVGLLAVISTILVVKLSDAGAFFVGKAIGRTKFTAVSPGKTLEGLVGGLGFAILGAWFTRDYLLPNFAPEEPRGSLGMFLLYGVSLMIAGLLGDLAESLLKRDVQQKDSSHWLPGLGGVMDIVDSLLAAAPVSFWWWSSGWI
jgi:phosphatidate cytidylyltransferase